MYKIMILVFAVLLIAPAYAEKIGRLEIPLAEAVPYEVKVTVNLYSSPRTLVAAKKVTLPPDRDKLVVDFSDQNIEQTNLNTPYVELISHLIKGDSRFYLSDLLKTCSDGTRHGECNQQRKFCKNGNLIDNCQVCGCPSGSCKIDGTCTQTFSSKLTCRQTEKLTGFFNCPKCAQDFKKEKCRSIIPSFYFETTCTREYETACALNPSCGSDELLKSEYCAICGNAVCDAQAGETCKSCGNDCGACPVPSVDIKADSQDSLAIQTGSSATLSWTSQNAQSCQAGGSWSGRKSLSGSESTGGLTSPQTYKLTCTTVYGDSAEDSVVVNVVAPVYCGDGACNGAETCSTCPGDCGSCPSGGASGYATLTCKSGFKFIEELCVSNCDDDCESRYEDTYGEDNVKSEYAGCCGGLSLGGKCFFRKDKCRCLVKETTTVSCSLNPSCPSSHPELASSSQCTLKCADGTPYGQCSSAPQFCDNGNLVNKASVCGCPSGYTQSGDSCVKTPFCGDGACNAGETCSSCAQDCGSCPAPPVPDFAISNSGIRSAAKGNCAIPLESSYNSFKSDSRYKLCVWDTSLTETGTDESIKIERRYVTVCSGGLCGSSDRNADQIQSGLGFSTTIPVDSSITWCNEWTTVQQGFTWTITESITGSGKTKTQTLTC